MHIRSPTVKERKITSEIDRLAAFLCFMSLISINCLIGSGEKNPVRTSYLVGDLAGSSQNNCETSRKNKDDSDLADDDCTSLSLVNSTGLGDHGDGAILLFFFWHEGTAGSVAVPVPVRLS